MRYGASFFNLFQGKYSYSLSWELSEKIDTTLMCYLCMNMESESDESQDWKQRRSGLLCFYNSASCCFHPSAYEQCKQRRYTNAICEFYSHARISSNSHLIFVSLSFVRWVCMSQTRQFCKRFLLNWIFCNLYIIASNWLNIQSMSEKLWIWFEWDEFHVTPTTDLAHL